MKKIFILLLMTFFLTSCTYFNSSSDGQKISPPSSGDSPIYGEWTINNVLTKTNGSIDKDEVNNFINKNFIITNKYFVLEGYYWDDINFKTKLVKADDYFNSLGTNPPSSISEENSELEIFNLMFRSKILCDVAIISEGKGILDISGTLYEISKTSSDTHNVDTTKLKMASSNQLNYKTNTEEKSGILLGLKTPSKTNDKNTSYRTIWISKSNDSLNPIYEINNILFPRKSGFWSIEEYTLTNNNVKENIFIPNDLSQKSKNQSLTRKIDNLVNEQSLKNYSSGYIKKELTYICNDFISVNITGNAIKNGEKEFIDKLHIYPVSSLPYEKPMSIDDILNGTSVDITRKEFYLAYDSIIENNVVMKNSEEQNKNIGIVRRDSHWLFTGKINYTTDNKFKTVDYDISILPPSNIVFYDNLFVPFEEIQKEIPFATDAFSSPNNDISIVTSEDYLYVYKIIKEPFTSMKISQKQLAKIKLKKDESVIMSEWATGEHVNSWNNFIKSLNTAKIIE